MNQLTIVVKGLGANEIESVLCEFDGIEGSAIRAGDGEPVFHDVLSTLASAGSEAVEASIHLVVASAAQPLIARLKQRLKERGATEVDWRSESGYL